MVSVVFALPVLAYAWFIHRYAVNVVWGDQWADLNVIARLHAGHLSLGTLWQQHNEERNFLPNLLVVLLADTTHFNVVVEMYVGALCLAGATALFVVTHRRSGPPRPWVFYLPVVVLLFSFVQYANTLWGFQVAWYMVLLFLGLALFLLDRPAMTGLVLAGAIASALAGSVSLFQGLLIWPTGLLVLCLRRHGRRYVAPWAAAGVVAIGLYFVGWNRHAPGANGTPYALHHPVKTLEAFFTVVGNVVGAQVSDAGNGIVVFLGVVIFVVAMWALFSRAVRGRVPTAGALGAALIVFSLLCDASVAIGRTSQGLSRAGWSGYTTDALLVLVGSYLVLFDRDLGAARQPGLRRADRVVGVSLAAVVCLQVVLGVGNGLKGARATYRTDRLAQDVIVNADVASDGMLYNIYLVGPPSYVRRMIPVMRQYRLSLFATHDAETYREQGLVTGTWARDPTSPVVPWTGLAGGQVVQLDVGRLGSGSRAPLYARQCTLQILNADNGACGPATALVRARVHGQLRAPFQVVAGPVGDGTCDPGRSCLIAVSSNSMTNWWGLSYAEIRFR